MDLNKLLKRKQKAIEEENQLLEAEACSKIGEHYYYSNKFENALKEFKHEAKLYEELNMKIDCGKANRMIAEVYLTQERFSEALLHENIHMKMAKEENDLVELQRAYATLGRIYLLKAQERDIEPNRNTPNNSDNDLTSAEKAFLKGLIISKELSKDISKFQLADMQSRIYLNLGITKEEMKNYTHAIDYYKTALKICKSNDLYELEHRCLMCLGQCYSSKFNDTLNAMQNINNALEVAKRIDFKNEKLCETLIAKSDLLIKSGDFHNAKNVLKKAYKLKTTVKADRDLIQKHLKVLLDLCTFEDELIITDSFDYENRKTLFEKLGDGSCKVKNYKKAIEFYQKQLETAELNGEMGKNLIPIYISLYQTYIDMEQFDDAMKYLELEYEIIKDNPKEACTTLLSKGNLLYSAKKNFWDVDAVYRKALCEARKAQDVTIEKSIARKIVTLCKENGMESLSEILEQEMKDKGINLDIATDDFEMSEDLLSEDINELDLELSTDPDSSDNEDVKRLMPKTVVRKKRSIAVKKNTKGETKLHCACIEGNYQLVKMLLNQGHPVNIRDNAGWLCIHEASNHGYRDIVELLLDHGAQSTINDKGGINCEGITPLFDACSNGHLRVAELLLERGAKATIKNDSNQTPLDALIIWYENNHEKLTTCEIEKYEEIKDILIKQCEKVGMDAFNRSTSSDSKYPNVTQHRRSNTRSSYNPSDDNIRRMENDNDDDDTDNEDYIKKAARNEYKSVMQKLKNPHKEYLNDDNVEEKRKRSAYLEEQEIELDDWLEDDLGPSKKKHKRSLVEPISKSIIESSTVHAGKSQQNDSIYRQHSSNNSISFGSNEGCNDNINDENSTQLFGSNSRNDFDVLVDESSGDSRFNAYNDLMKNSFHTKGDFGLNEISVNGGLSSEKKAIIKVQIGDEKIIVPINKEAANELKINWLVEESARRYYCLKGIRPELKLKTADGATLMDTDSLSLILCLTEENLIFSDVLDWKLPTISNRYLEACSEYKCAVDRDINEILDLNRNATSIKLSNQNLSPANVHPIFKAFQHQHYLSHLDLSNNFIQDEGMKSLTHVLTTLKSISYLNLSGNGITENGIEFFYSAMERNSTLTEIRELNLNFNPIKSISLKHLSILCRIKSILSLHLVSCRLSKFDNDIESFANVKELDISYNHFESSDLRNFIRKFNISCMEKINLERCTNDLNIGDIILHDIILLNHDALKEINLSGLRLSEQEIIDILRALQSSKNIKTIDLSYQNELTDLSMKFLLFNINSKNLNVNLIGCHKLHEALYNVFSYHQSKVLHHRCIKLSMPKAKNNDKENFLVSLKNYWIDITDNKGIIQQYRNILHLVMEN